MCITISKEDVYMDRNTLVSFLEQNELSSDLLDSWCGSVYELMVSKYNWEPFLVKLSLSDNLANSTNLFELANENEYSSDISYLQDVIGTILVPIEYDSPYIVLINPRKMDTNDSNHMLDGYLVHELTHAHDHNSFSRKNSSSNMSILYRDPIIQFWSEFNAASNQLSHLFEYSDYDAPYFFDYSIRKQFARVNSQTDIPSKMYELAHLLGYLYAYRECDQYSYQTHSILSILNSAPSVAIIYNYICNHRIENASFSDVDNIQKMHCDCIEYLFPHTMS